LGVDPLAEKYPGWSPYNYYTLQNPVRLTDPTGMEPVDWRNKNGDLVYDPSKNGGKGGYTEFATSTDKKFGNMLRNSGEIGKGQFEYLVNSSTETTVIFSNEIGYAEGTNFEAFGKTDKVVRDKDKNIESASITIYKGTAQEAMDRFQGGKEGESYLRRDEKKYMEQGNFGSIYIILRP